MEPLDAVIAARELLADVTPLNFDCGRICGGACCQPDEDGQGGMLLFPGEEALYRLLPDGFRLEQTNTPLPRSTLLICDGVCDRKDRPLSCRLFPLLPTVSGVRMDRRGWAVCPLIDSGVHGLRPEFVDAVKEAGRILYDCPEVAFFLNVIHSADQKIFTFSREEAIPDLGDIQRIDL